MQTLQVRDLMPEYPTEAALDAELATALAADGVSEEEKTRLTNLRSHKMSAEKWADFLKDSKNAKLFGIVVVVLTILLYIKYWA